MPNTACPPCTPDRQPGGAPGTPVPAPFGVLLRCAPPLCVWQPCPVLRCALQSDLARQMSALSCFLVQSWALLLGPVLHAAPGQALRAVSAFVFSWALRLQQPYREFISCFLKHSWGRKGIFVHDLFNTSKCCLYCVQQMQTLQPI